MNDAPAAAPVHTPAPTPVPVTAVPKFQPGWAFAAAATALAIALAGIALVPQSRWTGIAVILAAFAVPGWFGVGVLLVNRPEGNDRRATRTRALTALTATVMALVLAAALFALLFSVMPTAAYVFLASALAMVFWVDRAS